MVFDERTPLSNSTTQGSVLSVPPELKHAFQTLFRQENIQQAQTVAASRIVDLRRSTSEGDVSFRLLSLAGGASLIVSALLGMASHLVFFQLTAVVLEGYVFIMGIIMVVLESKQAMLPERFLQQLYKYALFLKFVWGRGFLYLVAGTLQLSLGSLTDIIVGGAVSLLGIGFIMMGRQTAMKLQYARTTLSSESVLRAKFRDASSRGQDSLTMTEFRSLMLSLGVPLSQREAELALLHVNADDNSELTYDEFKAWWSRSDAAPGLIGLSV